MKHEEERDRTKIYYSIMVLLGIDSVLEHD